MSNTPPPEEYTGRAAVMRDSTWLAVEDIDGLADVTVTIEKVHRRHNVEFELGRKKPLVYSIKFKESQRELVLNATNRNTMQELFGPDTPSWVGQRIGLYVDDNVKFQGKTIKGIRIRKAVPKK